MPVDLTRKRQLEREWAARNREHLRQYQRDRYRRDPSKQREAQARYNAKPGVVERRNQRTREYNARPEVRLRNKHAKFLRTLKAHGVTVEWFDATMERQGGKCAICLITLERKGHHNKRNMLCIDHCHTSGVRRGLLCGHCNIGIGYFCENTDALLAAAEYLKRHR